MDNPSVKQFRVIQMIEENTAHKFSGKTMSDARSFISKHIDESRKVTKEYKKNNVSYEHVLLKYSTPPVMDEEEIAISSNNEILRYEEEMKTALRLGI